MPRILLVHPFAQDTSGPDQSILTVIRLLVKEDYTFTIVLPGPSPFQARYEELGCKVFHYPMSIIKRRFDPGFILTYAFRFIPTILYLRSLIRTVKPDIVHTNGAVILGSGIAASLTGTPSIYHIRCSAIARPPIVARAIAWIIGKTSQRVIAISEACALPMTNNGYDHITTVVHNGIDLAPFANPPETKPWQKEYGLSNDTQIIGSVGRIGPDKGWLDFVRVCAEVGTRHPDAHFIAVGAPFRESEKLYEQEVRAEAERLGIADRIHFAGRRDNIATVMSGFDVFLTMAHEEGLGRVAIEAMAAGRPVVANKVHGLSEVVADGETGFLAKAGDISCATELVSKLLKDSALRDQMGEGGRCRAQELFSDTVCAENTAEAYKSLLLSQT